MAKRHDNVFIQLEGFARNLLEIDFDAVPQPCHLRFRITIRGTIENYSFALPDCLRRWYDGKVRWSEALWIPRWRFDI